MKCRLFLCLILVLLLDQSPVVGQGLEDPWKGMQEVLDQIHPPTFAAKEFKITDYGAKGDGSTDCTQAFANAIAKCNSAGGGRVIVPAGKYLTGPIHLKSNVNLHLTKGSEILFSQDTKKYLPLVLTRFEGIELMNYSPLIYAFEQKNIAITGEGVLNGQGDPEHWWPWKGRWAHAGVEHPAKPGPTQKAANQRLKQMAASDTPVAERIFGDRNYLRPNFVQPYKCENVLIEGVTIKDSPMWVIHPVLCNNVIVREVTVISHGPNSDGCDPESSRNILIENCVFDTGDDCIAIKSGRDHDGRRINVPSENIIVRNCIMKDGHGGVVIGSEVSGNVRNVYAEDCEMNSPYLDRVLRLKSNANRGGTMENIFMRNIKVGTVADAIVHVNLFYDNEKGDNYPVVRNILMQNVTSRKSKYAIFVLADESHPVENVRVENCTFDQVSDGNRVNGCKDLSLVNVKVNGVTQ